MSPDGFTAMPEDQVCDTFLEQDQKQETLEV